MQAFAERFNAARRKKGLSLQDVADQTGGITKQALHKYEQGKAQPEGDVLMRLCPVLGITPDYFMRPVTVSLQSVEFRKRVKLSKTDEYIIRAEATDFFERYVELEKLTGERIRFLSPVGCIDVSSRAEVEQVAQRLREVLKLGSNPILNVIALLESLGIKCFQLTASELFDGLTATIDNDAVDGEHIGVVINTLFDEVRQRFTACHELAHRILRFSPLLSERDIENLCHAFAGALLLPREQMINILTARRREVTIKELVSIKERFGVSIQAVLRRAKDLDIISDSTYTGLSIYITKKGWRKDEPGQYEGKEYATRFQRLLHRAVAQELITVNKAVTLSGQSLAEFRDSFARM